MRDLKALLSQKILYPARAPPSVRITYFDNVRLPQSTDFYPDARGVFSALGPITHSLFRTVSQDYRIKNGDNLL
jgi:hypothetical protein